jgi:hypothetical protein
LSFAERERRKILLAAKSDSLIVQIQQRFTASFIYKKLKDECNYQGSPKRIRTIVAEVRKDFKASAPSVFLNLDFELGRYLQIDHGEVNNK